MKMIATIRRNYPFYFDMQITARGEEVRIYGYKDAKEVSADGYGLTPNVDFDFYRKWQIKNKDNEIITGNHVNAMKPTNDSSSKDSSKNSNSNNSGGASI